LVTLVIVEFVYTALALELVVGHMVVVSVVISVTIEVELGEGDQIGVHVETVLYSVVITLPLILVLVGLGDEIVGQVEYVMSTVVITLPLILVPLLDWAEELDAKEKSTRGKSWIRILIVGNRFVDLDRRSVSFWF
jgi:hypothetical protein